MFKRLLVISVVFFTMLSQAFGMDNINFGDGYIYDGAGILRFTEKKLLNLYLKDLQEKTTSSIVIVTLPTLEGQRAEDRAMHINRAFRIGGYGKDNGIVLVATPTDNKIAIYTGYNVENAVPDIRKKQVINEIILPAFENKFYTKGIYDGSIILILDVAKYYDKTINGLEYKEVPPIPKTFIQKITPWNWAVAIFLLIAGILFYLFNKGPQVDSYMGFGGDFKETDEW